MYEEAHINYLLAETGSKFYYYYKYMPGLPFTNFGKFDLTEGKHEFEFRIYEKPSTSDEYNFKVDAIFLVPVDWKPKKIPFTLPADLFT